MLKEYSNKNDFQQIPISILIESSSDESDCESSDQSKPFRKINLNNKIRLCTLCYILTILFGQRINLDLFLQNKAIQVKCTKEDNYIKQNKKLFFRLQKRKYQAQKCEILAYGYDDRSCNQWYFMDNNKIAYKVIFCLKHSQEVTYYCQRCDQLKQMESSYCLKCNTPILYIDNIASIDCHKNVYCSICCTEYCINHKLYQPIFNNNRFYTCQEFSHWINYFQAIIYFLLHWVFTTIISSRLKNTSDFELFFLIGMPIYQSRLLSNLRKPFDIRIFVFSPAITFVIALRKLISINIFVKYLLLLIIYVGLIQGYMILYYSNKYRYLRLIIYIICIILQISTKI